MCTLVSLVTTFREKVFLTLLINLTVKKRVFSSKFSILRVKKSDFKMLRRFIDIKDFEARVKLLAKPKQFLVTIWSEIGCVFMKESLLVVY